MGQDPHVAAISGIQVDRNRVIATVLSTVFAAWGQLFFLQNLGTLNTYSSHTDTGTFSVAALLVSGATVSRATSTPYSWSRRSPARRSPATPRSASTSGCSSPTP